MRQFHQAKNVKTDTKIAFSGSETRNSTYVILPNFSCTVCVVDEFDFIGLDLIDLKISPGCCHFLFAGFDKCFL